VRPRGRTLPAPAPRAEPEGSIRVSLLALRLGNAVLMAWVTWYQLQVTLQTGVIGFGLVCGVRGLGRWVARNPQVHETVGDGGGSTGAAAASGVLVNPAYDGDPTSGRPDSQSRTSGV
jgi:hypothetical protein